MKKMLILILLITLSVESFAGSSCVEQFEDTISNVLSLSYQEYDQTPGVGLRSFSKNCQYEGALASINYLSNKAELTKTQTKNLSFHIGQALAASGHEKESIGYFKSAKYEKNPTELMWNEYIDGTVAFLNKNEETLKANIAILEKNADSNMGNKINHGVLKRLADELKKEVSYQDIDWTK